MLRGGNSREVVSSVKDKVELINRVLPAGVAIVPFYDRIESVARALDTVERALLEGAMVVVLVLYLFLRNLRGALVVALTVAAGDVGHVPDHAAGRPLGQSHVIRRFGDFAGDDRRCGHRPGGKCGASFE